MTIEPQIRTSGVVPIHRRRTIPQVPGVYLFVSSQGTILYVGKAKRLRARVSTYFTNRFRHPRLRRLRRDAAAIRYVVTSSELDALLLEDDLIKWYRPVLNRAQKDHHRSVYVRLSTKEPFLSLSIEPGRNATYYGPFKDPWRMQTIVELVSDYVGFRRSLVYGDFADKLSRKEKFAIAHSIFEGLDSSLYRRLVACRNTQSRLQVFEAAARTQEKITIVEGLQRWIQLLRQANRPIKKDEVDKLAILARYSPVRST